MSYSRLGEKVAWKRVGLRVDLKDRAKGASVV